MMFQNLYCCCYFSEKQPYAAFAVVHIDQGMSVSKSFISNVNKIEKRIKYKQTYTMQNNANKQGA